MQSNGLAIPLGGGDPTYAFISGDGRINPHISVAPCDEARSAPVYHAMGTAPSARKAPHAGAPRDGGRSGGLQMEHIPNAERGKHAVASNTGPHPSVRSEHFQKQLILCFLKTVIAHHEAPISP